MGTNSEEVSVAADMGFSSRQVRGRSGEVGGAEFKREIYFLDPIMICFASIPYDVSGHSMNGNLEGLRGVGEV